MPINNPAPSTIKSVQRGTIAIGTSSASNTATISSVVTAKSSIRFNGVGNDDSSSPSTTGVSMSGPFAYVSLTNATTVTASRGTGAGASENTTVSYEVMEFN